ncbi:hypothetical protein [Spirochaeta cellobiosiphila]|uniref:hypothetical protein n=1 Tax=Spirochaeta cellobiosiphila TaxID=504483 RepID=UPI000407B831|nr:hypothetical protein [Spirochaeta cellobiosiphila]
MDKEITFEFVKDPDYKMIAINGAWGGVTPRGEIKFDLFFEHVDFPEEVSYMTTPDGLGPEVSRDPVKSSIIREVMMGIVMTPENAANLGHWLIEKSNQATPKK